MTNYQKYILSRSEKLMFYAGFCIISVLITVLFYDSWLLGLLLFPLTLKIRPVFERYLCEKRLTKLKLEFVDFLYSLSSSFAVGIPMQEALYEARDMLSLTASKSLMKTELDEMIKCIEASNTSEKELLSDFALRSGIDDFKSFMEGYYISLESGGDLVTTVNKSTQIITDKLLMEKDMKTLVSQKVFEGRLIAALPPIVILFLKLMSPEYLMPLYTGVFGRSIMTVALLAMAYAFSYSKKLTKVIFTDDLESALPEFMSRLTLLLNSGMVLSTALERLTGQATVSEPDSSSGPASALKFDQAPSTNKLLTELKKLSLKAASENRPLLLLFRDFARSTGSREIIRFSGILVSNMDKGTELADKLERESDFMWHSAKKKIEEKSHLAETKMTFPMSVMLIVLILITIAPALMNLSL